MSRGTNMSGWKLWPGTAGEIQSSCWQRREELRTEDEERVRGDSPSPTGPIRINFRESGPTTTH